MDDTDSSGDEPEPTSYHEWKAFVVKTYLNGKSGASSRSVQSVQSAHRSKPEDLERFKVPVKDASGNPIVKQNSSSIPNPFSSGPTPLPLPRVISKSSNHPHHLQSASHHNNHPHHPHHPHHHHHPENNVNSINPVAKTNSSVQLKSRSDVFWSLNTQAKLLHVKSQLDEPSKTYFDKLVKNNGIAQREIVKLKKEKRDLINSIKMVEKIITDPLITHCFEREKEPTKF